MSYRHEELRRKSNLDDYALEYSDNQIVGSLKRDMDLHNEVINIFGQNNLDQLINVLNFGNENFDIQQTSVGDTLIDEQIKKVQMVQDLAKKYMQSLAEGIPNPKQSIRQAHQMIQQMTWRSMDLVITNMTNFVKGCFEHHQKVKSIQFKINL